MPTRTPRRTVFDLSPQELFDLRRMNLQVSASVPPRRPRRSASSDAAEYMHDYGVYEHYCNLHARARHERAEWLKAQGISLKVAAHAVLTDYKPYEQARRIGRVAPPLPAGYAQAYAVAFKPAPAKPAAKSLVKKLPPCQPGGLEGFSF